MKVLFDTNVIVDVLLEREPWAGNASTLLAAVERQKLDGLLGATTITTIFYLVRKFVGTDTAREHIRGLLALFKVAPVNRPVLDDALALGFKDLEDAVLDAAARHAGAEAITTRDPSGFAGSWLRVLAPGELVALIET